MKVEEGKEYKIIDTLHWVAQKLPDTNEMGYFIFDKKERGEIFVEATGKTLEEALFNFSKVIYKELNILKKIELLIERGGKYCPNERKMRGYIHIDNDYVLKEMEIPADQIKKYGPYSWSNLQYDKKTKKYEVMSDAMCFVSGGYIEN